VALELFIPSSGSDHKSLKIFKLKKNMRALPLKKLTFLTWIQILIQNKKSESGKIIAEGECDRPWSCCRTSRAAGPGLA
jgi:hypothetical protein